jgi:hypothetical protein
LYGTKYIELSHNHTSIEARIKRGASFENTTKNHCPKIDIIRSSFRSLQKFLCREIERERESGNIEARENGKFCNKKREIETMKSETLFDKKRKRSFISLVTR